MTGGQFYELLKVTKERMNWTEEGDGELRGRLKHKNQHTPNECFCPVTAVTYIQTKRFYGISNYPKAARDIKLNDTFAEKIVEAADYQCPIKVYKHLRNVLLG